MISLNKLHNILIKYSSPSKRANLLRKYKNIKIGLGCEVYNDVSFGSEPYLVSIGNDVRITKGVKFITHDGAVWVLRNKGIVKNADIFGRITIGNNVHIGINSIIMPGVNIGDNVIIGVGSIVTRDIPSNSVAVGVPAKTIKSIDDYYDKNKKKIHLTKNMTASKKKEYLLNKLK